LRGKYIKNYEGRDLSVINLEKQLFKEIKFQDFRVNLPQREDESSIFNLDQTYLIIIYNPQEELIGLPINSSPTVMKVGESVIISLPDSDPRLHNLQNINNNVIQLPDRGPIFLIENIFF
jgi:purine-binding chemotaxis protein CheW